MTRREHRSGKNLGVQTGLRATDTEQMRRWRRAATKAGVNFSDFARRAIDAETSRLIGPPRSAAS